MLTRVYLNITSKIKNSPYVLLLFICGQASALLCSMFVYGLMSAYVDLNNSYDGVDKTVFIRKELSEDFIDHFYQALIKQELMNKVNRISLQSRISIKDIKHIKSNTENINYRYISDEIIELNLVLFENSELYLLAGSNLSQQDINGKVANAVVYYGAFEKNVELDDVIAIHGTNFRVIGIYSQTAVEIPYGTIKINDFGKYSLIIDLNDKLNDGEKKQLFSLVNRLSPDSTIYIKKSSSNYFKEHKTMILISSLILILALLNISYLFLYLLNRNKINYVVYRICGSSARNNYICILLELLLYTAIVTLICTILNQTILRDIYINMHKGITYHLSWIDCGIVSVCYFVYMYIVFRGKIKRFNRQQIIKVYYHN